MTLIERLVLENQILQNDGLSQFQVYKSNNGYSFFLWGIHKTSSANPYELWSPIPNGYPSCRPPVYILKPNPLYGYSYLKTINSYGVSHNMHTLSNGPNGEVQICHWRDERWHSGITLNKVMIKVLLWLEAYEQHLSSGDPITNFVRTMY
jgi:hypothetical protein